MSEEILLTPELNRDFLARGAKNEKVVVKLTLYAHDDFVKAFPETHCDVVFVLDTSGSMNDPFCEKAAMTKRQGVAQAVEAMLPALHAADTISMICYDSATYVELDHVPGTETKRIQAAVQSVFRHNGATNFEKAFAAAKVILQGGKNSSQKVVFLTDGRSTEGSLAKAHKLNQDLAALSATVDCLGVGTDFNFNEMQKFSTASNGRTVLLGPPTEAGKVFAELLQGAQRTLLNHCVLRLALPAGCRDVEIYQLTPEIRYFDDVKPAPDGSIGYRINLQSMMQTHNYIYLIQAGVDLPPDPKVPNYPLLNVRLDYEVPVKRLKGQVVENTMAINLTDGAGREIRNTQVDSDYLEASLEKLDQEVNRLATKSDWRSVATLLMEMKQKAAKLGDDEKTREYQRRIDSLKANGRLTQDDLNWIGKSSTRSTRLAGGERPLGPDAVTY